MPIASIAPVVFESALADDLGRAITEAEALWNSATTDPVTGHRGVGVPAADQLLHGVAMRIRAAFPALESPPEGPDLFIATQIYKDGGHTGLLGDMARALSAHPDHRGNRPACLLVTNKHGHHPKKPGPAHLDRLGPLAENMMVLRDGSAVEKTAELVAWVRFLRPRRILLFHHPDDALPLIAASASGTAGIALTHHADAVPCLGLHLPGAILIDLNPTAAAFSRAWGLSPALLPMTAPDPGPRRRGFLTKGRAITATCARTHKIRNDDPVNYMAAVAEILAVTGGWHLHIGTLEEEMLAAIRNDLAGKNIPPDRLIYQPLVPSLSRALHEHDVDLYISSFPIDGARANVEVAAAGVPFLARVRPEKKGIPGGFSMDGRLEWTNWDDLRQRLREILVPGYLERKSGILRELYLRRHHPGVFAEHLRDILAGGAGWVDPDAEERTRNARRQLEPEAEGPSAPIR